jgi:hypothetical protein
MNPGEEVNAEAQRRGEHKPQYPILIEILRKM